MGGFQRNQIVCILLWLSLLHLGIELSASQHDDGMLVLRFKEMIEVDPGAAPSGWKEGDAHPCSWYGVECGEDGRVVMVGLEDDGLKSMLTAEIEKLVRPMYVKKATQRKLLAVGQHNRLKYRMRGLLTRLESLQNSPPKATSSLNNTTEGRPTSTSPGDKHEPSSPAPALSPSPSSSPLLAPPPENSTVSASAPETHRTQNFRLIFLPVGGAVCVLLALLLIYFICRRRSMNGSIVFPRSTSTDLSGQLQKAFVAGVPAIRRSELEAACENFSNIVDTLSDCTIYKGTLSTGEEIAVCTTLVTSAYWSDKSQAQFIEKIKTLSKVNHKNFMNLLGYCEEEAPFTRMMVYGYASNGTLFEHLHVLESEQLDWAARLRAAMGVIYVLEYMCQLNPPMILKNLESSSIYLTDDYAAKVSDIRFWKEDNMDPDLNSENIDEEAIVYKFGLLLLELISGKLPFSKDDGLLILWASRYLDGRAPLMKMVDPTLNSVPEEQVAALTELIKSCINPDTDNSITVSSVARTMRDITAISPEEATPRTSALWWAELEINSVLNV